MIVTSIICFIIGCLVFYLEYYLDDEEMGKSIYYGIVSFVVSFMIIGIISLPIAEGTVKREYVYSHSNNIMAFEDGRSYVISRYSVEQSDRYYYLVKDQQGFVKSYWVDQANSRLIETSESPHVKTYETRLKTDTFYNRDAGRWLKLARFLENKDKRYDFYIPEGSITQEFNVDLK